jgi:hypothetical protein
MILRWTLKGRSCCRDHIKGSLLTSGGIHGIYLATVLFSSARLEISHYVKDFPMFQLYKQKLINLVIRKACSPIFQIQLDSFKYH